MKRRGRRIALIFIGLVCLLLAIPVTLTWRQVRQDRLNQSLIAAVKRDDTDAVVSLLNRGANADCRDEPSHKFILWQALLRILHTWPTKAFAPTPLHLTLGLQSPPDTRPWRGGIILRDRIPPENVPLVRALLDHGAQVNQTDADGGTPLSWAISYSKNATIRLLLTRGANVNIRQVHLPIAYDFVRGQMQFAHTYAPLVQAVERSDIETDVIADLLDHGADVNQRDDGGSTALFYATVYGRVDMIRFLLTRHADVNRVYGDKTVQNLLSHLEIPHARQIVRLLKAAGAKRYRTCYLQRLLASSVQTLRSTVEGGMP